MDLDIAFIYLADFYKILIRTRTYITYIFVGDINIDIHSNVNSVDKDVYLKVLYEAGFIFSIDKYTRVSKTCFDHMFIQHYDYSDVCSAILKTDITDHYVISTNINNHSCTLSDGE